MAEEKKQERICMTVSPVLKEQIENVSETLGIASTQYILSLVIEDLKKINNSK